MMIYNGVGESPREPEKNERARFEQSKSSTAIRMLGAWKTHSQRWSATSPNRVIVGAPFQFVY